MQNQLLDLLNRVKYVKNRLVLCQPSNVNLSQAVGANPFTFHPRGCNAIVNKQKMVLRIAEIIYL